MLRRNETALGSEPPKEGYGHPQREEMTLTNIARLTMLVLLAAFLLAGPAFAAKEAISDQDLDRVSAAGTCKKAGSSACDTPEEDSIGAQTSVITQGTNGLQVTTTMISALALNGAQQGIRTLTLNNVVGTNQVANAMNVFAGGPR